MPPKEEVGAPLSSGLGLSPAPWDMLSRAATPDLRHPGQLRKRTGAPGGMSPQRPPDSPRETGPQRQRDRKGRVTAGGRAGPNPGPLILHLEVFPHTVLGDSGGLPLHSKVWSGVRRTGRDGEGRSEAHLSFRKSGLLRGACLPPAAAVPMLAPASWEGLEGQRLKRAPKRPRGIHIQSHGPVLGHVFADGLVVLHLPVSALGALFILGRQALGLVASLLCGPRGSSSAQGPSAPR